MYYTIYTYSYTNQPDLTLQWEPADPARTAEIEHVLLYYTSAGILQTYSIQQIDATQEELEDLLIMLGYKDSAVNPASYEIIKHLLKTIPIPPTSIVTSYTLGYVEFFQQRWYVPMFPATALQCRPVPTHLPPAILMEWYETELEATKRANILCRSQQVYQTIWDRCAALILKESNQQIPQPVEEPIDHSVKEVIDEYLKLYLEPGDKTVLLSEIYKDYKDKMQKIEKPTIAQSMFIKQLRTHEKYTIVRHARGMVITNYCLATPHSVMYVQSGEAYGAKHVEILKQYRKRYGTPSTATSTATPTYAQEAYFLLYAATGQEPSHIAVQLFLSERTIHVVKEFTAYLSTLEADREEMLHDDLNDVRIVEKRKDILNRVCIPFKFPFSKEIVEKGREMGNMLTAYDGSVFMNQYSYE